MQVIDCGALCRQLAMRQPWRLFGKCLNGWVNFTFLLEKHSIKHIFISQRSPKSLVWAWTKFPSLYVGLLFPKSVFICCYVLDCVTFPAALECAFFSFLRHRLLSRYCKLWTLSETPDLSIADHFHSMHNCSKGTRSSFFRIQPENSLALNYNIA